MSESTQDQGAAARAPRRGSGKVTPPPVTRPAEPTDEQRATAPQLGDGSGEMASGTTAAASPEPQTEPDPEPAAPTPRERAFPRERLLGPQGPQIVGHAHHVIAGALEGVDGDSFTREQVVALVEAWLTEPLTEPEEA